MDKERGKSQNPWRAVGMATAIGADLVICMGAGFGIGYLLRDLFGGHPIWLVVGIMLGFIAGVFGLIWLMRFYLEERNG